MVFRAVGRAFQPPPNLPVEPVNIGELAAAKKVVLHIFDHVLYLAFTLRIGLTTEYRFKAMFTNQDAETRGKHRVAKVLMEKKHLVLIIYYFTGHSSKELKRQFMGINGKGSGKWGTTQIDELVPAAA